MAHARYAAAVRIESHQAGSARRIACLGGAYGNLPALAACVEDARAAGADVLAFLGDSVGCCGHSDEVVDAVRARFSVLVAGNHEQEAASGSLACGCGYADADDERLSCVAFARAMGSLSEDRRAWLGTWPDLAVVHTARGAVLLCHGSPAQTNAFLYESTVDVDSAGAWLTEHGAFCFVGTHSGLPWVKPLADGRFAANCGVVGQPDNDGDPAVHWLLVDVEQRSASVRRVSYDHGAWASQLRSEGVDEVFVSPLLTGRWTTGRSSLPAGGR